MMAVSTSIIASDRATERDCDPNAENMFATTKTTIKTTVAPARTATTHRRAATGGVVVPRAVEKSAVDYADAAKQRFFGALGAACVVALATPNAALAEMRLPPIDTDPNRCERAFVGNTIGQANAVSDKVLDLRKCAYDGKDLSGKTLSGALMVNTSAKGANMKETVMSKVYAPDANFSGADFTNAVIDRATFDGSDMVGTNFTNAVITGVSFEDVDLTDADFTEALVGNEDVKRLCVNPTVKGETRLQIGCRN
jgi:hypothetical protein